MPAINIVSSVFSLADCTVEKQLSTQEVQFQRALIMALHRGPVFADKKMIVCCLFHVESCCLSDREKVAFY